MKAQIIIEKGQARLLKPVYLKPTAPKRFEIDIPDEAIETSRDWFSDESASPAGQASKPPAQPGSLQDELNHILGPMARMRAGASIADDHQTLLGALEDRYDGR